MKLTSVDLSLLLERWCGGGSEDVNRGRYDSRESGRGVEGVGVEV